MSPLLSCSHLSSSALIQDGRLGPANQLSYTARSYVAPAFYDLSSWRFP